MLPGLGHTKRRGSPDTHQVLDAAAVLRVGEFELFVAADRWWHGQARPENRLERIFVQYMFYGTVPPWVRQYCRAVLSAKTDGRLEPRAFGIETVRPPRHAPSPGPFYVAGTLAVALFVSVILHSGDRSTTHAPDRLSCHGGGPGLAAIENLAHRLGNGQPPPVCSADPIAGRDRGQR